MQIRDLITFSLRGFSGAWLSVASAIFGVAVAVAVPLGLAAFGYDLREYAFGSVLDARDAPLSVVVRAAPLRSLSADFLREFLNLPGVYSVSGEITLPGLISYGERAVATPVTIRETVSAFDTLSDSRDATAILHSSLALTLGDFPESLVGEDISLILFPPDENTSGSALLSTRSAYAVRVSSVTDDSGISDSLRLSRDAMPLAPTYAFDRAILKLSTPLDLPIVRGLLSERGFFVADSPLASDGRGERFSALALFSLMVLTALTVTLLVPWLAVRLTALLALRARDAEFLRSASVSPRGVFALILTESACIGFLGGAFGIALGVAFHRALLALLYLLLDSVPALSVDPELTLRPGVLLAILTLSSAIGVVSGVLPARRARSGLLSRHVHSL